MPRILFMIAVMLVTLTASNSMAQTNEKMRKLQEAFRGTSVREWLNARGIALAMDENWQCEGAAGT